MTVKRIVVIDHGKMVDKVISAIRTAEAGQRSFSTALTKATDVLKVSAKATILVHKLFKASQLLPAICNTHFMLTQLGLRDCNAPELDKQKYKGLKQNCGRPSKHPRVIRATKKHPSRSTN